MSWIWIRSSDIFTPLLGKAPPPCERQPPQIQWILSVFNVFNVNLCFAHFYTSPQTFFYTPPTIKKFLEITLIRSLPGCYSESLDLLKVLINVISAYSSSSPNNDFDTISFCRLLRNKNKSLLHWDVKVEDLYDASLFRPIGYRA